MSRSIFEKASQNQRGMAFLGLMLALVLTSPATRAQGPDLHRSPVSSSFASVQRAPATTSEEGAQLRAFVRDMVAASAEIHAGTADQLRSVLARHPEVLQWILDGRDLEPIFSAADLGDMAFPLNSEQRTQLQKLAERPEANQLRRRLIQSSPELRLELLKQIDDQHFVDIATNTQKQVGAVELHKSPAIQMLADPSGALGLQDRKAAEILQSVLPSYYKNLERVDKTRIILSVLDQPPHAAASQQLSAVLQASGPCMQKLFQLIGGDVNNPALSSAMLALQNEIKPFSGELAAQILEKQLGIPLDQAFKSFDKTPLAAASVGQVHRAVLPDGRQVVVKIRRPGLQEIGKREIAGLMAASEAQPAAHEMLKKMGQSVLDELNFRREARNIDHGLVYERPELGIQIARYVTGYSTGDGILITELAPGAKISKFTNEAQKVALRAQAVRNVLDTWFDEVIFGNGFFHGDLHPGNLFFEEDAQSPTGFRVTVIDFGNAGMLSFQERQAFVELALAVQTQSPERTLKTLLSLGKIPENKQKILLQKYSKIFQETSDAGLRLDRALAVSLENGLEIPASFIGFNRGRIFLEKQLASLNRTLDELDPKRLLPRHNPQQSYQRIAIRRVTRSVLTGWWDTSTSEPSVVTARMLLNAIRDKAAIIGGRISQTPCVRSFSKLAAQVSSP